MHFLVQGLYLLLIILPIVLIVSVSFVPVKVYRIQKSILKKISPKSPDDSYKLVFNLFYVMVSVWCILFFLISLT